MTQVSVIKENNWTCDYNELQHISSARSLCDSPAAQSWGKKRRKTKRHRSATLEREQLRLQPFQLWLSWLIYTLCPLFLYGAMGSLLRVTELLGKLAGLGQRNETPLPGAKSSSGTNGHLHALLCKRRDGMTQKNRRVFAYETLMTLYFW